MKKKSEVWQGNKQKYLSNKPLMRFLNNKLKRDIILTLKNLNLNIKNILDIGCGEGFITSEVAKNFPKTKITAIDPKEQYLNYAKKFNNLPNIRYEKKDLSYKFNRKFDLVIITEVLEHLPNPEESLKKTKRLSKKFILITVPNEPFFRIGNLLALKYAKRLGNTPGHLHNWSKNQLYKILTKLNFTFKIKTSTFWNIAIIKK